MRRIRAAAVTATGTRKTRAVPISDGDWMYFGKVDISLEQYRRKEENRRTFSCRCVPVISPGGFMRPLSSSKHSPCSRTVEMDVDEWLLVNC